MLFKSWLLAAVAVGGLFTLAAPAHASGYVFSTITAPTTPAGDVGLALGINDFGNILVAAQRPGVPFAFEDVDDVYNLFSGTYTPIPQFPGSTPLSTVATGLNNLGTIVGFYNPPGGDYQGFALNHGVFTGVNAPGSTFNTADGINNLGQVVGTYGDNATSGYLYSGGVYTPIVAKPQPLYSTGAIGINDHGLIIGNYGLTATQNYNTGFFDIGGHITSLSVPGEASTQVGGVNKYGIIVGGSSNDGYNTGSGFLYHNGVFTPIDFPGAVETFVYGINDVGDLVGEYTTADGTVNAFLALPPAGGGGGTPEPATWAMMLVGLAGLGGVLRRGREKSTVAAA